jgi:flagellin-specific chaperone FliS
VAISRRTSTEDIWKINNIYISNNNLILIKKNMREQITTETSVEKDPKEIAQEAIENFLEAYREKYQNEKKFSGDFEKNILEYMMMFESGDYINLKDFLNKALNKYMVIQKRMYETGPVEKDSAEEKTIMLYENMVEKAEIAIEALEGLV